MDDDDDDNDDDDDDDDRHRDHIYEMIKIIYVKLPEDTITIFQGLSIDYLYMNHILTT